MEGEINEPEINNITGVQFSIMSPDEIRNRSVVEITKYETYDKDVPVIKGLFDQRMGVTEMGKICKTCGQKNIHCPGHFGHIELARPVYHYHFHDILLKVLKCVCFKCSKLLIDKENNINKNIFTKNSKLRFNEIYTLCQKINKCGHAENDGCGCKQPDKYKFDGLNGIQAKWSKLDTTGIAQDDPIMKPIIDIEYIKYAEKKNLYLVRTKSLNATSKLIQALASVILGSLA